MDTHTLYSKFENPDITAKGEQRAWVDLTHLHTLWFNTGSLCNITCKGCFMDSSPTNDRLAYLTAQDVRGYLDEIETEQMDVREIGFTGGEPFMNPDIVEILTDCLKRGYRVLILTNAMKPLHHKKQALLEMKEKYPGQLNIRVSIDHYTPKEHESLRGRDTWAPMVSGLTWLAEEGFELAIAGRTLWHEEDEVARQGYADLFVREKVKVDAFDPVALVLFPEMDVEAEVPEITTACWDILNVHPNAMMCATSRMIVKHKGQDAPNVVPCTLLPYEPEFDMGATLLGADKTVKLNHPHCAKFCVLGGGACSQAD